MLLCVMTMNDDEAVGQLDSVKHLYLRHLFEPRDNSLRLIVEEAVENRSGVIRPQPELAVPDLADILRDASPIESIEGCRKFELYWKRYVAYLVTEEMVASCGAYEDEVYRGTLFRIYEKSHFLEHLARDTGGHCDPVRHYKIVCLNHVIDVAAYAHPDVRLLTEPPLSSRTQ
jgi:hypothetical protein